MGLIVNRTSGRWPWFAALSLLLIAGVFSCSTSSRTSRNVSSSLLLAPVPDNGDDRGALLRLVTGQDFLQVANPNALPSELAEETVAANVLALLGETELLLSDTRSNAIFSIDYGPDFSDPDCIQNVNDDDGDGEPDCERVQLHYDQDGLADALRSQQSAVSQSVQPIALKNGWVLAFEVTTRSIIGFKRLPPQRVEVGNGEGGTVELELGYRVPALPIDANFGRGNGVIVAEVVTMTELQDKTGSETVAQIFEIEENKILVLLNGSPAIHLLEVEEVVEDVDYDLRIDDPQGRDVFPTPILRGAITLFPRLTLDGPVFDLPFLGFPELARQTGDLNLDLDDFFPVIVPDNGAALYFDTTSSNFLEVSIQRGPHPITGEIVITGGFGEVVVAREVLLAGALQSFSGDELRMSGSFLSASTPEIMIMEEETNNLIAYDYTLEPRTQNVRIFVPQAAIVAPRQQDGSTASGITTAVEPELAFSTTDVRDNRLSFDEGLDQLLSVNLTAPVTVVVLTRQDLISSTGEAVVDLTFVDPLDDNKIRVFDETSASLLDVLLDYRTLPTDQKD